MFKLGVGIAIGCPTFIEDQANGVEVVLVTMEGSLVISLKII